MYYSFLCETDLVFYVKKGTGVTFQTGADVDVRNAFINNGRLDGSQDNTFRAISDRWPVFSLAYDLGKVSDTTSAPAVFVLGLAPQRDGGCTQFIQPDNSLQERFSYFLSEMNTTEAVRFFTGCRLIAQSADEFRCKRS